LSLEIDKIGDKYPAKYLPHSRVFSFSISGLGAFGLEIKITTKPKAQKSN